MSPALREKIAEFLDQQKVFEKSAAGPVPPMGEVFRGGGTKLKNLLMAHRGKLGVGLGAAGVGGIATAMGKGEQKAQQEAEELNQLLEAYPELLYQTPQAPYQPEPDPRLMGYPQY